MVDEKGVWQQWSRDIGAEFIDGGFLMGWKDEARFRVWTITFDT